MSSIAVQAAQRTCIGARTRNEDCIAIEQLRSFWCLAVCDGAGGHGEGARAAQLAVDRIRKGFHSRPPADPNDLRELVLDAHDAVVKGQRELAAAGTPSSMCATAVVLVIDTATRRALWAHVGDSRLYLWRGGRLHIVTRDDSVAQAIVDSGLIDATKAHKMHNRSVLLAALGSAEDAAPHVSDPVELLASDAFLLCSDGWWSSLDAQRIEQSLSSAATPDEWLDAMIASTRALADPGQDNYSALACWLRESTAADTQPP
jgi:serine/threonine protein phosphatase PrpC